MNAHQRRIENRWLKRHGYRSFREMVELERKRDSANTILDRMLAPQIVAPPNLPPGTYRAQFDSQGRLIVLGQVN